MAPRLERNRKIILKGYDNKNTKSKKVLDPHYRYSHCMCYTGTMEAREIENREGGKNQGRKGERGQNK